MEESIVKESEVQKQIQYYLSSLGAFHFKTIANTTNGIPDLIACLDGKFVAIEVKKPGGKPSPLQVVKIRKIEEAGGIAFIAYSVEDVKRLIEKPQVNVSQTTI